MASGVDPTSHVSVTNKVVRAQSTLNFSIARSILKSVDYQFLL